MRGETRLGILAILVFLRLAIGGEVSPDPSSAPALTRIAVIDFKSGEGLKENDGTALADSVRSEFHFSGRFDIIDRQLMRERLGEKDFAATTECDQVKCLVKYGRSLDAQKIVGGFAHRFDNETWILTIRFVDVDSGRQEKFINRTLTGSKGGLLTLAQSAAQELLNEQSDPVLPPKEQSKSPPTITINNDNIYINFVLIPAGSFLMGDEHGDSTQRPVHRVRIARDFYMSKYEITYGQYRRFAPDHPDAEFMGRNQSKPFFPVGGVTWNAAQEFCSWLSRKSGKTIRLPSEAEWEYACRAGTKTKYWWGDEPDTTGKVANIADVSLRTYEKDLFCWSANDGFVGAAPVGSFAPNAFGLYDMAGNVWEWCEDETIPDYRNAPSDGSAWTGRDYYSRRIRGGSWECDPKRCANAFRGGADPDSEATNIGFRIVLEQD